MFSVNACVDKNFTALLVVNHLMIPDSENDKLTSLVVVGLKMIVPYFKTM